MRKGVFQSSYANYLTTYLDWSRLMNNFYKAMPISFLLKVKKRVYSFWWTFAPNKMDGKRTTRAENFLRFRSYDNVRMKTSGKNAEFEWRVKSGFISDGIGTEHKRISINCFTTQLNAVFRRIMNIVYSRVTSRQVANRNKLVSRQSAVNRRGHARPVLMRSTRVMPSGF